VVTLGCGALVVAADGAGAGAAVVDAVGACTAAAVLVESVGATVVVLEGTVGESEEVDVVGAAIVGADIAGVADGWPDDVEAQPETKAIARRSAVKFRMSR
jgi:hypothetical protein